MIKQQLYQFNTETFLPLRTKTITIQPGLYTGQDAEAAYTPGVYDGNAAMGTDHYLRISDWTWYSVGAGEGWSRSFIKFTALDTLPASAVILSAKLSLYALSDSTTIYSGFPGDSYYPGSSEIAGALRTWSLGRNLGRPLPLRKIHVKIKRSSL